VATIYVKVLAYQDRLDFWKRELESALRASRSGLAVMPMRFVTHYERKIACLMARQDLYVPERVAEV
jgi:hypothetical protein